MKTASMPTCGSSVATVMMRALAGAAGAAAGCCAGTAGCAGAAGWAGTTGLAGASAWGAPGVAGAAAKETTKFQFCGQSATSASCRAPLEATKVTRWVQGTSPAVSRRKKVTPPPFPDTASGLPSTSACSTVTPGASALTLNSRLSASAGVSAASDMAKTNPARRKKPIVVPRPGRAAP